MDVWLISLENGGEIVLSPDEELRAARFHFEGDRARWIRAHSALRIILAKATGIPAKEVRMAAGPHGKPSVVDGGGIEFSLSHSGSWGMVAVTRQVPVGVDIERIRENVNLTPLLKRLGEKDLPDTQIALYRRWTRREATSKAHGGALFDNPGADFRVYDLAAPEGYSASLALIGIDPKVRRHHDFAAQGVPLQEF